MEQRTLVMAKSLRFYKIPCCLLNHPNSILFQMVLILALHFNSLRDSVVYKVLGMRTYKHLEPLVKHAPGRLQDAGSRCVWQMLHKKFTDSHRGRGAISGRCILELWKGCFGLSITGRFYWRMLDFLQC